MRNEIIILVSEHRQLKSLARLQMQVTATDGKKAAVCNMRGAAASSSIPISLLLFSFESFWLRRQITNQNVNFNKHLLIQAVIFLGYESLEHCPTLKTLQVLMSSVPRLVSSL